MFIPLRCNTNRFFFFLSLFFCFSACEPIVEQDEIINNPINSAKSASNENDQIGYYHNEGLDFVIRQAIEDDWHIQLGITNKAPEELTVDDWVNINEYIRNLTISYIEQSVIMGEFGFGASDLEQIPTNNFSFAQYSDPTANFGLALSPEAQSLRDQIFDLYLSANSPEENENGLNEMINLIALSELNQEEQQALLSMVSVSKHTYNFWTGFDPNNYGQPYFKLPGLGGWIGIGLSDVGGAIDGALFGSIGGPLGAVMGGVSGAIITSATSLLVGVLTSV